MGNAASYWPWIEELYECRCKWGEVFAAVAIMNALYSVGFGLLAIGEHLWGGPAPHQLAIVLAGVATIVATTAAVVWYAESKVSEGIWDHLKAGTYYFAFVYLFARYIAGMKSVKGWISDAVLEALLVQMSMLTPLWYPIESTLLGTYTRILKWTKLAILATLAFFIPLMSYHLLIHLGWM